MGALRAHQRGERIGPEVEALFGLAHRHLEAGRVRLVAVGGAPGTGKAPGEAERIASGMSPDAAPMTRIAWPGAGEAGT